MSTKHEGWGWMLAVDFFFAGMGGAMLLIAGIIELFVGEGRTSLVGNLLGPVFMCVGCAFLVFELGRPFQSWRVFMNPKAILTAGAWTMSIAIVVGLAYASFGLDPAWFGVEKLFWQDKYLVRKLLAVICVLTGLVVAAYPGVLLARHKGRPFWVGPGMITLFLLSSLVTGVSAHFLSGFAFPPAVVPGVLANFPLLAGALLFFQLVVWFGYLWVKRTGATAAEADSAQRWIAGDLSGSFKFVFLFLGTLVPMVLFLQASPALQGVGALFVLLGGVVMRCLVVRAGHDRTWLPGEQKYRGRLPLGDEAFLKAWNK
ncbi:NrfD/PsrC family molybdoenzyme membrane anchor subunit [Geobacter sp. AOG2]|uniref:NrfD/PsrC family molybdoenzyme membrane anchor subunit n=1 Tax=Geobacter sp. AOG2 TaxID=1566347 RepID=UPI001CC50942|nr:NrfD/PsrC family molybdoenzyme membrane anchor subunit [Geobacter sp. AOG2]GFE59908.1 oxidoreductase [Geobacter sp. AOG2]